MTYEEVLSYFKVKQTSRDKAKCICPAHADKEASLTISRGKDGKTIMKCFAGCGVTEIVEAVGLKVSDLFNDEPLQKPIVEKWRVYVESSEGKKIEGVYNYSFCNGEYAFTRLRLSGKDFKYGRLNGDRFTYGLGGKSRKNMAAVYCKSVEALKKAGSEGKPIFYCEGEKDVNTVNSKGLMGVTCGGANDWAKGCATLFTGADVIILADNDSPGMKLAEEVEKDIKSFAKSVRIIVPTPEIPHGDISDYFKNHTIEDFNMLLNNPPKVEIKEESAETEKADLSRFHLSTNGKLTGVFDYEILVYLKEQEKMFVLGGIPFIYEDGVYRMDRTGAKLKTVIRSLIYPKFVKSTTIKRIFELFISDADLQVTAEQLNQYPVEWINFRNGFYDPVTKKMIPHDPKYLATNQIPWEYNPESQQSGTQVKKWLDFICDTPEDVEMLSQYAGLCLTRDTRQQKFLILNGEGGSGKSTLIRMFDLMIGAENISNISLNQLTQRFSAYGLMGKLLNSCADLEIDALSDVSTLKKCLGEDMISAEAKGKDAISFKSYAKLVFSTNQLPIVKSEQTNGFYRRLLILTMNKVPERRETDFFDNLSADISDFIIISVKALERLYVTRKITESSRSREAVIRLRCDSDTVEAFLNEKTLRVQDGAAYRIKKQDLYKMYEVYCSDVGRQSHTKQNFYRSMKAKGFGEVKTNGEEFYKGIAQSDGNPFK